MIDKFFEIIKERCFNPLEDLCQETGESCAAKNCPVLKSIQAIVIERIGELREEKKNIIVFDDFARINGAIDELIKDYGIRRNK